MARVPKTLKKQARYAGRDTFKRKITWAIKSGDLVEDKSGNIGLALRIVNSDCFMLSPTGQKRVRLSQLIKVSEDV